MKIYVEKIPKFLSRIKDWAGFIVEDGKKKPISLIDGKGVGANDKDRLVDFETAAAAIKEEKTEVIGVSLTGEEITCIDLDCHGSEKKEQFEKINAEILELFKGKTYAEVSISGTGTHIYVKGKIPEGYKHCDKDGIVEVYSGTRFIIVTGDMIEGSTEYVGICQEELNEICEKYLLKEETFTGLAGIGVYTKSDQEVIEKIRSIKRGKLFLEGKWKEVEKWDKRSGIYIRAFASQSDADLSFANMILYYNGNNPEQCHRLFTQSGMWDEKRKSKKSSGYLATTIDTASRTLKSVYQWDKPMTETQERLAFEEIVQVAEDMKLVEAAKDYTLDICFLPELNEHLGKYIQNFGSKWKQVYDTTQWDYDSASNGIRFWLFNQDDLIYQPDSNEWLAWNGKYWDRYYDKNLLYYAEKVFHYLKHEAFNIYRKSIVASNRSVLEEKALEMFKYASANKGRKECLEMIDFSKAHFIKAQKEKKILQKINANMNVVNLDNGVFHLGEMKFYPHDRRFYQTQITPVPYQENAECPLWTDFMEMVLPDEEIRRFFQKAVGYTVSSEYMQKCLFILYGPDGNNGKTTINKTLYKIMGDYAVTAEKQTIMESRNNSAGAPRPDLVRLRDRRLVCISESEKDDKLAEGLVKNLTGGGVIICRTLHQEPIEFYPYFKIFLDTNYEVQVKGTDKALFRRLKIIPFNYTIPPEKIDTSFGEKLDAELSGIMNWAIEGYRLYQAEGLEMPEEMQKIIKEYAEDMSPLDQWIQECIDIVPGCSESYTSKELYQSYYNWCKFNHENFMGQRRFTQELNQKDDFKNTKKVNGYIKYNNIWVNGIGQLFAGATIVDDIDFRKDYNKAVNAKIKAAEVFGDPSEHFIPFSVDTEDSKVKPFVKAV